MSRKDSPWARPSPARWNSNMDAAPHDGTIIDVLLHSGSTAMCAWREETWWGVGQHGRWTGILKFKPKGWRYVPDLTKAT